MGLRKVQAIKPFRITHQIHKGSASFFVVFSQWVTDWAMPTATESRWDSWRDEFELRFVGWDGMDLPTNLMLK
ncbi:MAG: hypothetical protein FJ404_12185 [Verrucomicrobia bacterium]|nr:hypothetical protein [Verrucomicrobiota bacterium]